MKKIFSLVVASFFLATSAFALVDSESGPINYTSVYVTDMGDMTSGDVVILKTTTPTYWGREVTGTTTPGLPIYGVVLGEPTRADCAAGTWIRVQTSGYCPIVKLDSRSAVTANAVICTGGKMFTAAACQEIPYLLNATCYANPLTPTVTGASIALESAKGITGAENIGGNTTFKALL